MAAGNGYTPTQRRILDILSDGQPHLRKDVMLAMQDTEASREALAVHIARIRRKLLPIGQTILGTRKDRRFYYIHVRLLNNQE
jgi:hypothetical protein